MTHGELSAPSQLLSMAKFGVSFSGGGTRSAAFCSGVLRRLLQKEVQIDYLSCVSGGGCSGSAFVDWKYRHGKKDNKKWHQEYFNHLRENAGLVCNFQKPCRGFAEFVVICAMILFVSVIAPFILWGSYAYPLAFVIDYVFGDVLRGGTRSCQEVASESPNITFEDCEESRQTPYIMNRRFALFAAPLVFAFICFVLKGYVRKGKRLLHWLLLLSVSLFGVLFFPWFLYFSLRFLPDWMKIVLVLPILFIWISFPLARRNATLMIVIYLYSFTTHSRIYRMSVFGVIYTKNTFNYLLSVSVILLWIGPLIEAIQRSLPHICVRWIIQKGFYYPQTVGEYGCSGISWRDLILFWPASKNSRVQHVTSKQALTLDDVDDLSPIYIACTTVNGWRRTSSPGEPHYEVLTMSPHGIERLDRCSDEQELHGKLLAEDVYLSDAAATSNAAVSYDMGVQQCDEAPSRDLKVMLGLSAGAYIVADQRHETKRHFCVQYLPLLIELIRLVPLALILFLYARTNNEIVLVAGMLIHLGICLIFSLFALVPTGGKYLGRLERLARWFTINVSSVHYYRLMMDMTNVGPNPPPVLSLSDGGHLENLGILPLLKLRLEKIVVVDGGRSILDKDYGKSLMIALDLARKKLGCSFSAVDGRDIAEDIRDNFVERSPGSQPSNYRFKVHYYDKNVNSDGKTKVGEGDILYIVPRHPDKAVKTSSYVTWKEALRDTDGDLEAGLWGPGPELSSEEANQLTFCCCECCHGNTCRSLSEALCGMFPHHSTNHQFFTPTMFTAYHREGYRAGMEAKVAEFVPNRHEPSTSETIVI